MSPEHRFRSGVPFWRLRRRCRGSDDGLAGRPIALKHGVEESDRLGEASSARRRGDPERGLALQFNRFRNPYGAERMGIKMTLIQWVGKTRNLCVDDHRGCLIRTYVVNASGRVREA